MEAFKNGKFQAIRDERAMAICKDEKKVLASSPHNGACHIGVVAIFNRRFSDFTLRVHTFLKGCSGGLLKASLAMLLVTCVLMAETAPPVQTAPRTVNPNFIPTFDEGFFKTVGPGTELVGRSDAKVTSEVSARIRSECDSRKSSGTSEFSKCVREKEDAVVNAREKEIDRINMQNNLPLRNTPKLIEDVQAQPTDENND